MFDGVIMLAAFLLTFLPSTRMLHFKCYMINYCEKYLKLSWNQSSHKNNLKHFTTCHCVLSYEMHLQFPLILPRLMYLFICIGVLSVRHFFFRSFGHTRSNFACCFFWDCQSLSGKHREDTKMQSDVLRCTRNVNVHTPSHSLFEVRNAACAIHTHWFSWFLFHTILDHSQITYWLSIDLSIDQLIYLFIFASLTVAKIALQV